MEIRTLKYFLAVAKLENITRAAEELHITQPTLSRQLSELEEELGVRLFIRGKRKTQLTEDGFYLKARAEEIVGLTDKTLTQFAQKSNLIAGDIYIGCGETEAMREVVHVITDIQKKYPHIKFHFTSGNSEMIDDYLQKGLLDFGVVCRLTPPLNYAYRQLKHQDRWGVILRRDNPLANQPYLTKDDLRTENIIVSKQALAAKEFDNWFGIDVENLNIAATYNLHYNTRYMVEEGLGSVLSFENLMPETEHLVFRRLQPEMLSSNYIVWRKGVLFSRAAMLVKQAFDELI